MNNKQNCRIAFIGVGYHADIHANNIKELIRDRKLQAEIVGCLPDTNYEGLKFCKKFGGKLYKTIYDLVSSGKPGIVFVCSPPCARDGVELELAKKGINIFLEKPVAVNNKQVSLLEKVDKLNNILTHVSFVWRFAGGVNKFIDIISKEDRIIINGYKFCKFITNNDWSFKKEKSGGFLVEQTVHLIDLFYYLNSFNELSVINGVMLPSKQVKRIKEKSNIEDGGNILLKSKNKIFNLLFASFSTAKYKIGIELITENYFGSIFLDDHGYFISRVFDKYGVIYEKKEHIHNLYKKQVLNFIRNVERKTQIDAIPLSQGIKTSKLCLEIYKKTIKI